MERWLKSARVKWWLLVVKRKRKHGHYAEALKILQEIIRAQPNRALAFVYSGICLSALKRHDEAIDCYERALQIIPNYGDAHAYLSLTYRALGRNEEAVESLNRAVRIRPSLFKNELWVFEFALMSADTEHWEQASDSEGEKKPCTNLKD